jgi:hypothetical protein
VDQQSHSARIVDAIEEWKTIVRGRRLRRVTGYDNPATGTRVAGDTDASAHVLQKTYISGGRTNDRNTDKGEVGGSSPPGPTINHQYLCGHSHFFCLPVSCSKTHFPTICQLSGQADLSAKGDDPSPFSCLHRQKTADRGRGKYAAIDFCVSSEFAAEFLVNDLSTSRSATCTVLWLCL